MCQLSRSPALPLSRSFCVLIAFCLALFATVARADVVAVAGKPAAVGASVLELTGGELKVRLASGREISHSIADVEYLQIAGWPLFNLAEKQYRDKHYRPAIAAYERTLSELRDKAQNPKLNAELLVWCRLTRACDADGQFDRAVEWYLQVLDSPAGGAAYLGRIRPSHLPPPDSNFMKSASAAVSAAINRHQKDEIGASLAAWRDGWGMHSGSQPAATSRPAARNPSTSGPPVVAKETESLAAAASLIEAGKFAAGLDRLRGLHPDALGQARSDWFYWQGRALLGIGEPAQGADDLGELRRAGLSFMRVVIHDPGHARVPECLFRAGDICRRTGQPEQAVTLWSELLRNYPDAMPWAQQARTRLYQTAAPGVAPASGR